MCVCACVFGVCACVCVCLCACVCVCVCVYMSKAPVASFPGSFDHFIQATSQLKRDGRGLTALHRASRPQQSTPTNLQNTHYHQDLHPKIHPTRPPLPLLTQPPPPPLFTKLLTLYSPTGPAIPYTPLHWGRVLSTR